MTKENQAKCGDFLSKAVHACALRYDRDGTCYPHAVQVSALSKLLFDSMHSLFPAYSKKEREILAYAALLHDIGTFLNRSGHHKISYELICKEGSEMGFSDEETHLVALIARYHRKAVPSTKNIHYNAFSPEKQKEVRVLSALLRIADGLDYTHDQIITDIECTIKESEIICRCTGPTQNPARSEFTLLRNLDRAREKSEAFTQEFDKQIIYVW
jgi:exopolyphosphatase/guanosine-5'-triphosphate,3'-diphosphate pyrophosphatase